MKIKELNSWEQFEIQVQNLFSFVESQRKKTISVVSQPLFRGQDDSNYQLESTLDRIQPDYTLRKYHKLMRKLSNIIGSCTGRNWEIPEYVPPETAWFEPQAYDFMVYLRHHGFPSPLLDWSRSHYIAAFFAFNSHTRSPKVSIFSFIELMGYGKVGFEDAPLITGLGPNVRTDKRHYLQQCEYTICTKEIDNEIHFAKYEEDTVKVNLEQDNFVSEQDITIKYNLPASEKKKVLSKLDSMNINEYSLFGTEEALMGTLRNREFPL